MTYFRYGVRKGIRGLREYHIEQEQKKEKKERNPSLHQGVDVNPETALDRVLFESLKGCGKGIIPSLVWPAHLGAYAIVKWKEDQIVAEVREEIKKSKENQ